MATHNDPMVSNTCPRLKTYEEKRQENLKKIQDYYNELLNDYQTAPTNDPNRNSKGKYKEQILVLVNEMLKKLKESTTELIGQHELYIEKKEEYNNIREEHDKLLNDIKSLEATANARQSNTSTKNNNTFWVKVYHRVYLSINIIFLLVTIFLLAKK
jgi:flagellar biosynthesis chaperone FliJ